MFIVGQDYENRRGRYKVLAIEGDELSVQYEDGTRAVLSIPSQLRIMKNMKIEQDFAQSKTPPKSPTVTTARLVFPVDWSRYDRWNDAVFNHFFAKDQLGKLVYIDIDDEMLAELAPDDQAHENPLRDFVGALRSTLEIRGSHLVDNHLSRVNQWKQAGSPAPPPFVSLLALFCLAAHRMQNDQDFTANNYYDRLAQVLFGSSYTRAQRQALSVGLQKADLLWSELERWLWGKRGHYGLPSAQPMYRLAHVGWPISQALLRSHDRRKLPEFFGEAGLDSGQDVPPPDMEHILDSWLPTSPLSQAAKASWNDSAARRRMAEVVSLELGVWDGSLTVPHQASPHAPTKPIALQVTFLSGPRPRMVWGVVLPMAAGATASTFDVDGDGGGMQVGGRDVRTISAVRGMSDRWSEPVLDVSVPDLLVNRVDMTRRDGPLKCAWHPRKVLVLTWDDEIKVFRSGHRLEFGRRSVVLAYKTTAADVERVLAQVSDGSMRRVPDSWGVPEDWVVFKDVRLTGYPDTGDDDDLAALVPTIWSSVEWNGGISLPGKRQWLSSRLPVVHINSIEDVQCLSVGIHRMSAFDRTEDPRDAMEFTYPSNSADLDLQALNLTDGIYGLTVVAFRGDQDKTGEILARPAFEVRSSDSPLSDGLERLSHRSDKRQWALSGSPETDGLKPPSVTVEGALVHQVGSPPALAVALPSGIGPTEGAELEDLLGARQHLQRTRDDLTECFRGAHHWVLTPALTASDFYRLTTKGECVRCGLLKAFHRRRSFKASPAGDTQQQAKPRDSIQPVTTVPIASAPDPEAPDYDGLFEACAALGGGPWAHFELLARQSSSMPAFPHEAIQLFSALGHIDLKLDEVGAHVVQWRVAPPALVVTVSGHAYLAGYCSPQLLKAIREATLENGGTYTAVPSEHGPTSHRVTGLEKDSLAAVVESVNRSAKVRLSTADRPDITIASALPPLRNMLTADHEAPEREVAARFDIDRTTWVPTTFPDSEGLYRIDSMPRSYSLRRGQTWYRVSYRTGKHLAGAYVGKSLLAYNHMVQQLVCPLGAQLPGLYERAAVLSSGLPPVVDLRQGKVVYQHVPREVAATVWAAIYSDNAS